MSSRDDDRSSSRHIYNCATNPIESSNFKQQDTHVQVAGLVVDISVHKRLFEELLSRDAVIQEVEIRVVVVVLSLVVVLVVDVVEVMGA